MMKDFPKSNKMDQISIWAKVSKNQKWSAGTKKCRNAPVAAGKNVDQKCTEGK